jgi:parallel beta-helix repeat protein
MGRAKFKNKLVYFLIFLFAFCNIPGFNGITHGVYASKDSMIIRVPGNYLTIQEAIDAADINDTILVADGIYYENVVISKPVSLISENGNATIRSVFPAHVIKVIANNVNIVGFTIEGAQPPFAGIYVNALYCNVTGNYLVNNYRGIYIYDSSKLILRKNGMRDNVYNFAIWGREVTHFRHDIDESNTVDGKSICYLVNCSSRTVLCEAGFVGIVDCFNITVKDLDLKGNEEGVLIAFSDNCTIENTTFSNNNRGILVVSSQNNLIIRNNFSMNSWSSISLYNSKHNLFEKNVFLKENIGFFILASSDGNTIAENLFFNCNYGIWVQSSYRNLIIRNNIAQSRYKGVAFEYASQNSVLNNYIGNNENGFWLYNSANNTIYHNNFVNNTIHVYVSDITRCENKWYFGYPFGGNFWSDYKGEDADHDGIGDVRYIIEKGVLDEFPLIAPISTFEACVINVTHYYVNIISNSTISGFHFSSENTFISFNLTVNDSSGFCRVSIPKDLLWVENEQWMAYVDNQPTCYIIIPDENYTHLYFTYSGDAKTIRIKGTNAIPEFSLATIMFLMMATLLSTIIMGRKKVK